MSRAVKLGWFGVLYNQIAAQKFLPFVLNWSILIVTIFSNFPFLVFTRFINFPF